MPRLLKIVVSGAAIIVAALGVMSLVMAPAVAGNIRASNGPAAQWSTSSVNLSALAGTTTQITVTLIASAPTPAARVLISKRLRPYVTVSPSTLGAMQPGAVATIRLTVSSAITATPGTTSGFLRLREAREATSTDDTFCDGPDDDLRIARRLPVTVKILPLIASVSIGTARLLIPAPVGWVPIDDADTNTSALYSTTSIKASDFAESDTPPDVAISVVANPDGLTPEEFVKSFRGGKFAKYSSSTTQVISGQVGIVVDDAGSDVPFEPARAAVFPQGNTFVVIAAYRMTATDFATLLTSLQ